MEAVVDNGLASGLSSAQMNMLILAYRCVE